MAILRNLEEIRMQPHGKKGAAARSPIVDRNN
jgi:hypothetical protein